VNLKKLFLSLCQRFPLFRLFAVIISIFVIVSSISLITYKARKIPSITSISPQFGSPGDVMEIYGKNFGSTRGSSYVEIGGSKLTSSSYLVWNDDKIRVILPTNVQDGLVIVGTRAGTSKKNSFFANESGIPVPVPTDARTLIPSIAAISPGTVTPGSLLTITGMNFGSARNNSQVYFSSYKDYGNSLESLDTSDTEVLNSFEYVTAQAENFDYEVWSDTEIQVRIPDGAKSGIIFVKTDKGSSNHFGIDVKEAVGNHVYHNMRHYVIQINCDVQDMNSKGNTSLTLRVPRPKTNAQQPYVDLIECQPDAEMKDYDKTICHILDLSKTSHRKTRFTHKFVVYSYAVQNKVDVASVQPFDVEKERPSFKRFIEPDTLVRSDDSAVTVLAAKICGAEKNPYKKAQMIYNYMAENFKILDENRDAAEDPVNLLIANSGDAYDFAICYTALLRASGIPAVTCSGILVDADKKSRNHWWAEFYISNFGWVCADPALGAGLAYKGFGSVEDPKSFYFGNLDSQHILFSRGLNDVHSTLSNGSNVYRQKSYALQSIWEETTAGSVNYSSLWNDPVVQGIY